MYEIMRSILCLVVLLSAGLSRALSINRRIVLRSTSCTATTWGLAAPHPARAKNLPDRVDSSRSGSPEALEGILNLKSSLQAFYSQIDKDGVDAASFSLPSREKEFKKIFDSYSDAVSYKQKFVDQNAFLVYYSKGFDGPGRPNIESDLPVKQTLQFGARNDAWINFEEALAEIEFQKKAPGDRQDILKPLASTIAAIDTYLEVSGVKQ